MKQLTALLGLILLLPGMAFAQDNEKLVLPKEVLKIGISPERLSGNSPAILTIMQIYNPEGSKPVSLRAASDRKDILIISGGGGEQTLSGPKDSPVVLNTRVYRIELQKAGTIYLRRDDFTNLPASYSTYLESSEGALFRVTRTK